MVERLLEKTGPSVQLESGARTKGERTRDRILDLAYDAIIHKGFAATSIEELVEAAGITKGGFFYHFRDKNDLARQLLERFIKEDEAIQDTLEQRARSLSEDPLQSFLIFLNLYAEMLDNLPEHHPGCLVASMTYQDRLYDAEVRRLNEGALLAWRSRFSRWLDEIAAVHPPRAPFDSEALADQVTVIVEGAIIFAKALGQPALMGRQMRLFRDSVKLLFGVS